MRCTNGWVDRQLCERQELGKARVNFCSFQRGGHDIGNSIGGVVRYVHVELVWMADGWPWLVGIATVYMCTYIGIMTSMQ